MRFSIIIPVYKVERYLREAVSSILAQTCDDYEIILVDDGSPDSCPRICDDLAENNSRIKVIHKSNGGSSDARNVGTAVAQGDYIIYLDSDDQWVDRQGLENISRIIDAQNPDVVIFGVEDYDPGTGKSVVSRGNYEENVINALPTKEVIDKLISDNNFPGAAWMLATRKEFLIDNRISFVKGVTAEDFDWIVKVFSNATSIKAVDRVIYRYRYTSEGSITSKPRLSGVKGIHNALSNWLAEERMEEYQSITDYLCYVYLQALLNYFGLNNEEREQAKGMLICDSEILRKSASLKYKVLGVLIRICGVDLISKAINSAREKSRNNDTCSNRNCPGI